jgi:hypothetical protein
MKKTIYISTIFAMAIFLLTSCKDTLDLAPIDYYGSSNFWKTLPQVEAYVNGIHLDLRSTNFTRQFLLGEARGGLQKTGTSSQGVSLYDDPIKGNTLSGDVTGLSSWAGLYGNIFDCNLVIQTVEGSEIHKNNKEKVDILLGETYGIRALYYFTLYRTYGGVPMVRRVKVLDGQVSPTDLYTGRATPKVVMDSIKSDIQKSLNYFGTYQDAGAINNVMWSKVASQMLAAEIYLWSAKVSLGDQKPAADDLTKAENYLLTVKNDSRFGLLNNFTDVFSSKNENNKEIIFAINYADGEATSNVGNFLYAPASMIGVFYDRNGNKINTDILDLRGVGIQRYEYTNEFWLSFNAKDKRRDATFMDYYDNKGKLTGTVMKKFLGSINSTGNRVFDANEPLYRYSDVLLMLAEVENMKGGDPAKYINQIRQRAYGSDFDASTDSYINSDFKTNELEILKERDKEFVYEGKRWYDVCRLKDAKDGKPLAFDNASTYKGTSVIKDTESYKLLWPVDKNTLNNDPLLKQTPGYKVGDQQEESW